MSQFYSTLFEDFVYKLIGGKKKGGSNFDQIGPVVFKPSTESNILPADGNTK